MCTGACAFVVASSGTCVGLSSLTWAEGEGGGQTMS
jgi:hypothetical protein